MLYKILTPLKGLVRRLSAFYSLNKINFEIKFLHEGNITVRLPRSSWFDVLSGNVTLITEI